jgi:hypothetical protein
MPRIDPTVAKEAEDIYKSWERGERGYHTSKAIIEYEHRRLGIVFTPEQETRIRAIIKEMMDR